MDRYFRDRPNNDEAMIPLISSMEEYREWYERSVKNPESFWAEMAETFKWRKKWDKVVQWNFKDPDVRWFEGGRLNITENCLDRHLQNNPDKIALIWEPNEPGEKGLQFTYRELHEQVCKTASMLKKEGVKKGDKVCIYLPMIPELTFSVLACARLGAVHSVIFAGFSAKSLSDRINDASCSVLLTADGLFRGKKTLNLKQIADEALLSTDTVKRVIVVKRTGEDVKMHPDRDLWWDQAIEGANADCPAEEMDSEDPLFILYTSGSTGKPKGVVHTCGGYMVYSEYSFRQVFQYQERDIYWCTADIGWITGHSYIIYGPLLAGATTIMFEGVPTYPDAGRFWQVVEKHKVSLFYTAPTAIRALEVYGDEYINPYDLSSLRVLGSVGEPINEEAWEWYHEKIGKGKCTIVDTWWQTETGGILISPLADITPVKPSWATLPLPGVQPALMDSAGIEITEMKAEGNLCIKFPWPSMLRTIYGDHERCRQTYFSSYPGYYFTGDGARRDENGNYRITGRVDDVINVSGHRLGTAEIEDAINEHELVVESAVVAFPHKIKGQGIYAYVICAHSSSDDEKMRKEIIEMVAKQIGPIAKPDHIQIVTNLPKTRSGKIMRRILRKIAEGKSQELGDVTTLLDPEVVEEIKKGAQKSED